ncbi:hypothetical protein Q9R32_03700 [Actinotalea sp. AC32]|nr:hypothetical protein [Actinotalea sp. AC32]
MSARTAAWHARPADLAAYADGTAGELVAASVETHLVRCGTCREELARLSDAEASRRRWDRLADVVDRPRPTAVERLARAAGLVRTDGRETLAGGTLLRTTLAVPSMRAAWLAAVALVALGPLVVAGLAGTHVLPAFLGLAPVAPAVAVVLAYRTTTDPAGELAAAAPTAGLRLVAWRSLAVAGAAVPLGLVVGVVADLPVRFAAAWVLPGLALAMLVLACGTTRVDPALVAAVASGAWTVAVGLAGPLGDVAPWDLATTVSSPAAQGAACAVALAAGLVSVARRDAIAYRRSA